MNMSAWPSESLGELFDIGAGKSVTPGSRVGDGRHPFLRTSNVLWGRVDLSAVDAMHYSADELLSKALSPGDLLVCEGGEIGRAAIWNGDIKQCGFQNHLHRLRPKHADVLPRFFMYYLQAGFTQFGIYEGAGNKTTIPNLSRNRLAALEVPKPSREEQERITAVLWKAQRVAELEEKLAATARELKAAAMRQIFMRGLRSGETIETPYGDVPANWSVQPLGSCCHVQTGVTKGRKFAPGEGIELPYLRVANVQDGYLDLSEIKQIILRADEVGNYLLRDGDVVLTEGGDFDKLGRGFIWRNEIPRCVHQNHVFAVRPNQEFLSPEYLSYLTQSPYGKSYFLTVAHKTTNLACINSTKLKAFPVLLPRLDEQSEIVGVLGAIDRKIALHERRGAIIRELFASLLHRLMTGEVRVNKLDIDVSEVRA